MDQRHVKGTMLADFVRMIRANKDRNWDAYLEKGDWEIINSKIYPTQWYSLGYYQRFGFAIYKVLAGGDLETVRMSGRIRGRDFFREVYSSAIAVQDPARALGHFAKIYSSLFDFSVIEFERVDSNHVIISHDYDPEDEANTPYCFQLMGYIDTLIGLTGGTNPRIELTAKQWEGAPTTVFDITWD
jgi:hypothetical protein